jgi:3-deoxy-D-manno-octulosonic-acid transferase
MSRFLNVIYIIVLIVASPLLLYKSWKRGKYREGWSQKVLGLCPERVGRGPCVWFHAVSMGEVRLLKPLIAELERRRPDWDIVISTTTETGLSQARQLFPELLTFYAPLDFSWATRQAMKRIQPTTLALVELELWPNLIRSAEEAGARVALLNGRLSARSQKGYRKIRRWIRPTLARIDVVAVQTEDYADRFRTLGLPAPKLKVTGSIKYDNLETDRQNPKTKSLREAFGIRDGETVFVAGSTMSGEEDVILNVYENLVRNHPKLRLIVVPRHPERFDEVARAISRRGLALARRSSLENTAGASSQAVILVDTLGELSAVWGLADLAFVGGSLFPGRGGQNMMEPAAFGASVHFGEHTANFRDTVQLLMSRNAAIIVRDGSSLEKALEQDLREPAERLARGLRARDLVLSQAGATGRTVSELERLMHPANRSTKSNG